jgi:hypothetical protein
MINLLILLLVVLLSIVIGVGVEFYRESKNKRLVKFNDNIEVRYFNSSDPPLLFE